jgi:hypothetical protein
MHLTPYELYWHPLIKNLLSLLFLIQEKSQKNIYKNLFSDTKKTALGQEQSYECFLLNDSAPASHIPC